MRYLILIIGIHIIFCALPALFSGCAQVQPLSGGERDSIPPQLDSARSTPNLQIRFQKQPILLFFDEFIDLKDVFNQVVVSPPLEKRPTVTLEKYKRVKFEFDEEEVLRPDATYTIQFGDAIKDFTEGNASPIRFIFSTGDYLDSLMVMGKVVDAFDGKPVEKVLVMLYDNLADTAVRKELPFYFSKTDKQGNFRIENVKSDTFRVLALEDANLNYRFDQVSERIGFLEMPIHSGDSVSPPILLRFFLEEAPLQVMSHQASTPGLVKLVFNREPWDLDLTGPEGLLFEEMDKDTVLLWHEIPDSSTWQLFIGGEKPDTISIKPVSRPSGWGQLRLQPDKRPGPSSPQNPSVPVSLRWNFPLKEIRPDSIQLWEDSIRLEHRNIRFGIDSLDKRSLRIQFDWEEGRSYRLLFMPGAFTAWQGTTNDSVRTDLRIAARSDFGNLLLRIDSLDANKAYVAEILQQEKPFIRFSINAGQAGWERKLELIPPGTYQLRLIEDLDANGRWDPGNYDKKLQPERLLLWPIEAVRANWDVEAKFILKWEERTVPTPPQ